MIHHEQKIRWRYVRTRTWLYARISTNVWQTTPGDFIICCILYQIQQTRKRCRDVWQSSLISTHNYDYNYYDYSPNIHLRRHCSLKNNSCFISGFRLPKTCSMYISGIPRNHCPSLRLYQPLNTYLSFSCLEFGWFMLASLPIFLRHGQYCPTSLGFFGRTVSN